MSAFNLRHEGCAVGPWASWLRAVILTTTLQRAMKATHDDDHDSAYLVQAEFDKLSSNDEDDAAKIAKLEQMLHEQARESEQALGEERVCGFIYTHIQLLRLRLRLQL